jgi:sec-independent protein translocase protein TatA
MFRNPTTDVIVVLVIVLLIFGPKRLPGLGRSLGQGMREFKDSITGNHKDEDTEQHPELTQATQSVASASAASANQPVSGQAAPAPSQPVAPAPGSQPQPWQTAPPTDPR